MICGPPGPEAGDVSRPRARASFPAFAMPRLFCLRRPTFVAEQKWAKVSLEPAVLRTPLALTCTDGPVPLAWQMLLSAGGRYDCPRVRASARWPGGWTAALLAWWVDGGFLRQQKPSRMALAWWLDGSLAGLAGRRGLLGRRAACCRFPRHLHTLERTPRAERSDRTSHPQLSLEAGAAI